MMVYAKLFLIAIMIFVVYTGIRMVFDKDWAWQRQERINRQRGIADSEETPEWEGQSNLTGWFMIVVGIIVILLVLSTN